MKRGHNNKNMTDKDKKIIADAEKNGTPIFVLTAKDQNSIAAIWEYFGKCEETNCAQEHIDSVGNRYNEFIDWQDANKKKVNLPD